MAPERGARLRRKRIPLLHTSALTALTALVAHPCEGSTPHSIPEVKGSLLPPSAATRALSSSLGSGGGNCRRHRRRREGRAELLDPYDGLVDDTSPERLAPDGPRRRLTDTDGIADFDENIASDIIGTGRFHGGESENGYDDDVDLALPSPSALDDDLDGDLVNGDSVESSSSLTSLLVRPPPMSSRLSWSVPPIHQPRLPPSSAAASLSPSSSSSPLVNYLRKTGTTIAGVLCDGGRTVVIGADTRATDGTVVADKRCEKVHRLADNVWCCGAGTSGDIDALVRRVRYRFLLRGMLSESVGNGPREKGDEDEDVGVETSGGWGTNSRVEGEQSRLRLPPASVSAVCRYVRDRLYRGGGSIGANLVLGGYDLRTGCAVLAAIHPHGSMDVVPYTALGSGGLAATAVLESRYPSSVNGEGGGGRWLTLKEAKRLVVDAIVAGISNDMGSGSQVDLCVIGPDGVDYQRAVVKEERLPGEGRDDDEEERVIGEDVADEEGKANAPITGVNGFGSLPFFVRTKRVIMDGEDAVRRSRESWLEGLLGLEDGAEVG